ncbi:MAG: DegT/DnrJ/EryC1/StrS family aminotransferase [Bacteroidales bacterium]|jgi:dTDP-4-amino-4,6-dideoxygalactose transaminase|nr:DegT/DnrJ/EryC1/StrS family aminotransferase [Bacteroidales bacterium]
MEFRDLKKQYEVLKPEIDRAMIETAKSSHYIMGQSVKDLESSLAKYVGVNYCKSCSNGTDALTLALKVWDIGVGDAVFVPDFTFFASAEVVALQGATPIFVDVDNDTFNIDALSLEEAIKAVIKEGKLKPKVIIAVDLFGLPANFHEIRKIADKYNLFILEDGAQGFGGMIGDKRACSFGDIATTSFFPAKPLGCYGDGGAVFTDNEQWASLIDSYRVHGKGSFKYDNVRIGLNSRLDTIQAAILQVKFKAFQDYELKDVNNAAMLYTEKLQGKVKTPIIRDGFYSSWAQYTIILNSKEERDALQIKLKDNGIPSMVYYPTPMSKQTAFKEMKMYVETPNSMMLSGCVLSLPIHPYITEEEINKVIENIE